MYFQVTLLLPGQVATKTRMNRLHVVTVFNFQGATRNENIYILRTCGKLLLNRPLKRFIAVFTKLRPSSLRTQGVCSSGKKIASEGGLHCRKVAIAPYSEEQKD